MSGATGSFDVPGDPGAVPTDPSATDASAPADTSTSWWSSAWEWLTTPVYDSTAHPTAASAIATVETTVKNAADSAAAAGKSVWTKIWGGLETVVGWVKSLSLWVLLAALLLVGLYVWSWLPHPRRKES